MSAEKITGAPLEAYCQQRIFKPLGMVDTCYAVPAAKQSRVPTQHSRLDGLLQEQPRTPIPSTPTAPFRGDGGLYSTAQDYAKFVQMLLSYGRLGSAKILSESSVKMMGENNIGSIFVELQSDADKCRCCRSTTTALSGHCATSRNWCTRTFGSQGLRALVFPFSSPPLRGLWRILRRPLESSGPLRYPRCMDSDSDCRARVWPAPAS